MAATTTPMTCWSGHGSTTPAAQTAGPSTSCSACPKHVAMEMTRTAPGPATTGTTPATSRSDVQAPFSPSAYAWHLQDLIPGTAPATNAAASRCLARPATSGVGVDLRFEETTRDGIAEADDAAHRPPCQRIVNTSC